MTDPIDPKNTPENAATRPTEHPLKLPYTSPRLRRMLSSQLTSAHKAMLSEAKPKPFVLVPGTVAPVPPGAMKFHVLGIPHTITRKDFTTCAFTQKVVKLCQMLTRRGHHVIHYGTEGSDVECTEHVSVTSNAEWSEFYAHPGTGFYDIDESGKNKAYLELYKSRLHESLKARSGEGGTEIICMTWGGTGQRPAVDGIDQWKIETGIGYEHSWADYRVYESYAWMHMHLGMERLLDGKKWYWSVIPNSFDLADFPDPSSYKRGEEFLYLGRLNDDKGVSLAIAVAKAVGRKITIVGQGDPSPFLPNNPHVTYLPPVGPVERAKLLGEAYAVFTPSQYVEPFCGVSIEAQIMGAPVITTDWGAFTENVLHGVTGYRCRTFEQFVWAAKNIDKLDRHAAKIWARANFSNERVVLMYEEFFQQVLNLKWKPGFYQDNPGRTQLDWLKKAVPVADEFGRQDNVYPEGGARGVDIHDFGIVPVSMHTQRVVPPVPPPELVGWAADQQWERNWWGLDWAPHWDDEIKKQDGYFRLIGFPDNRDFGTKRILDVGGGPISILQRSNHGSPNGWSRSVDPIEVSDATRKRYQEAEVEFLNIKAEGMPAPGFLTQEGVTAEAVVFDEIWMYNLLQHTDDPHEIMRRMIACSKPGTVFRIFEWIDLGICPGHPQNLTEEMFAQHFGGADFDRPTWNVGFLRGFGGTATDKYIAIVAVRK